MLEWKYGGKVEQDIQQPLKTGTFKRTNKTNKQKSKQTDTFEEWEGVIFCFLLHKFQVLYKEHELLLQ